MDSASNPVDGLSRKDFRGVWQWREIYFPRSLQNALESVVSSRLSGPKVKAFKPTHEPRGVTVV